ncbi:DUF885 domain-containing protein [Nocardioides dongxiaopingii]|uniref:DUF885 domain-containing protein n=1 Tax=Nocardioides TaxID=1839 RepID=UPI0010C7689A|nr:MULTISPECIES: DUF885 domain-containing protein [Nocardioides]QCW49704.1 DUF885 domain-containing protein [Nocardioides sp. S-1144]
MTNADLQELARAFWDFHLETNPTEAHLLGDYRYAAFYEDETRAAEDRRIEALRTFVDDAEAISPGELDAQEQITRDVLISTATTTADRLGTRLAELAADPIFGVQVGVPIVTGMLALPDAVVAEAFVDKLRGVARSYGELADRLREGVAAGRTPARFAVADTVAQLDTLLAAPLAEDAVLTQVPAPPAGVDADAWRARVGAVVGDELRPAMAGYRDVLREEVLPHARPDEQCGLVHLPDGEATYAALLRYFTTTTKSAQEIHDLGLAQVAKLAEEYRALGPEVVGTDDLARIFEAMRTDPALHFERGEQLVEASRVAMARAWDAMPGWFEVLPRAACAVEGTTSGAKAFYFPPAGDGSRGGTFFINVDDPASWGTFELEAMAFHEGIPGHHLQLAIAAELEGVPEFRKHIHNSAYAEGWGLYTERLADEMGLYSSAVDRMGMYAADSMRACRLVVDTGIHALGWTREQAVAYMVDNSPLADAMVRPEIDRYIVTPGQACSYMVGRVEVERIRREAEARQGASFDVRAFHSAVLDSGSLPLDVLDRVVAARLP